MGHGDVRADQLVGVGHHLPVLAGEGLRVHAVAELTGFMPLRHFALGGHHRAHLAAHALHRFEQAPHFVVARRRQRGIQAAFGDIGRQPHRFGQRPDRLAAQQHVDAGAEHQRRAQAHGQDDPQQRTRLRGDQRVRHHHAQGETLLAGADAQRHVRLHVAGVIHLEILERLVRRHGRQDLSGGRIIATLADLLGVRGRQHDAAGRDQLDMAFAHRAQRGQAFLQRGQAEVDGDRAKEGVLVQYRRGQGGHQHLLAGDLVVVRFGHGLALERTRAQVPVAITGDVVALQRVLHRRAVLPGPVAHEAAGGIVRLGVHVLAVLAVERLRFPQCAQAHPFRVRAQLLLQHLGGGGAGQRAGGVLHHQAVGQGLAGGEGGGQVGTDPARFGIGLALHGLARGIHQRLAGFTVADGGGDAEAEHGDQCGPQHQPVGDASGTRGGSRAGRRHGGGSGKKVGSAVAQGRHYGFAQSIAVRVARCNSRPALAPIADIGPLSWITALARRC